MTKTILITGSTDGIGLLTAQRLAGEGHKVLLHGRNPERLKAALDGLDGHAQGYLADMSDLQAVVGLAQQVKADHPVLDVLINNAGVYKTPHTRTETGFDTRFVVNSFAPALLTNLLMPIIPSTGRVVNLSTAAQAPVDIAAMSGQGQLDDFAAYAQSKLALTIWSQECAKSLPEGPVIVSVNPGSLLASKMVKEGFGVAGNDLGIGADILRRAALDDSFANMSGRYFDNDSGAFAAPHPAAEDPEHCKAVMTALAELAVTPD
ncbi:SDR family NAD(P)-dependent oxidoreductase [uncultured Shimia sp.]|uniref:SDR family NAD(P)-dependent oxidoreductase n=1 Tax=uncultured Shimia sp. TaxID=573152 RepID=UPI002634C51A|nr:SDR family NAD(P)-dependent oxidoreductase [uncultured Shimia sp.]